MALIAVLLTVVACTPAGRAAPDGFTEGSTVHTISYGGTEDRSYRVYIPAGLPNPAPLVVMLHGGFGSAEQAERSYGWDQLADSAKFVVAYPDGVGRAWNVGGGCCGRPGRQGIDDVGFITSAVADISSHVGIDPARVYATGISNGGMMAYSLACNTSTFAAVGPDSATQLDACTAPHPTSVLHIHGTADQNIRYDGEPGAGVAGIDGPPVPDLNAFWRNVDRCSAPTTTTSGPVTTSAAECPAGRAVALITIDGAGHQWPGSAPIRAGADPPSPALDATTMFWQFFAAHPS
jgi:polyhydroxybutyrate depolymerase